MGKIKLLLGGSPCTHWSIAQMKNRETEPSGLVWELFLNYKIARDKYRPDFFLYENNKSMSAAIRAQITRELGVEPVLINSALVSAQNRQRLYWAGRRRSDGTYSRVSVEQPEDRGILLRDILESGVGIGTSGAKAYALKAQYFKSAAANFLNGGGHFPQTGVAEPVRIVTIEAAGGKTHPVYEIKDGQITIKGKQYPAKLADGWYLIRKLTVRECMRLQTVPEDFIFPVSDTQAYRMLGNGWTVDVIAYILSCFDGITADAVEVLSMYDGMSCGHIALDQLGVNVVSYYATEIDKYAIETTQYNYPDTIQLGNAFRIRDDLLQ